MRSGVSRATTPSRRASTPIRARASRQCISTPASSTRIRSNTWRKKRVLRASCSARISPSRSAIRSPGKSSRERTSTKRKRKAYSAIRHRLCSGCGPTAGARVDGIEEVSDMTIGEDRNRRPLVWRTLPILACLSGTGAFAQYPAQPVKMLLPYAAGGVADITARVLGQRLSQTLRQQVIIDNRPSAGQIVATEAAMKAEPDGYTLLWLNQGHAVSVSLFKSLPYDPVRDFAPISTVGFFGLALLVNSDSPYRSLKDFIAAAKATPGRLNVGPPASAAPSSSPRNCSNRWRVWNSRPFPSRRRPP